MGARKAPIILILLPLCWAQDPGKVRPKEAAVMAAVGQPCTDWQEGAAWTGVLSLTLMRTLPQGLRISPEGTWPVLVLLPLRLLEHSFTFRGICPVTCLYGRVEVFDFTISQGRPSWDVSSSCTCSQLTIRAAHDSILRKARG